MSSSSSICWVRLTGSGSPIRANGGEDREVDERLLADGGVELGEMVTGGVLLVALRGGARVVVLMGTIRPPAEIAGGAAGWKPSLTIMRTGMMGASRWVLDKIQAGRLLCCTTPGCSRAPFCT